MKRLTFAALLLLSLPASAFDLSIVKKPGAKEDAVAKAFTPDPAAARLYAFRDNAIMGRSAKSNLVIGGRMAATTGAGEFAVVTLAPGAYEIGCVSSGEKNMAVGLIHNRKKEPLTLTVEAGKIYFVQEVFKGAKGFELKSVDPAAAEPIIKKGRLVEDVTWK